MAWRELAAAGGVAGGVAGVIVAWRGCGIGVA